MRSLFYRGSRLIVLFTLPAAVVILLFGNAVLDLWIGAEYTDIAESVLWLTVGNFFFSTCLWTPLNVLMAAGRIRQIFWISVGEVGLVLILILLLVPHFELPGLALAGLIANVLTGAIFFIPMACRQVRAAPLQYAGSTILIPLLAAAPLVVVAYLGSRTLELSRWFDTLLGSVLTGVGCIAAVIVFAVPRMERMRYFVTVRHLLGNAS